MALEAWQSTNPRAHLVSFPRTDSELTGHVADHLFPALDEGGAAVVVIAPERGADVETELAARGVDVDQARREGRFVSLDADATLAALLVDGAPDRAAFDAAVGSAVREAVGSSTGETRAFGEMVSVLWDRGDIPAAIELEMMWNDLGQEIDFSLLCAYRADSVAGDAHSEALRDVCRLHSAVVGPEPGSHARESRLSTDEQCEFPAAPRSPGAARRFVVHVLERWESGVDIADAASVVTELATNAVVHGRSHFTVTVARLEGGVRISVHDLSPASPVLRAPVSTTAVSGRGLGLVDAMATRWGVETAEQGKSVWAEFRA